MILSHKRKFIFLKTTKTAGTSVELWLSQFCGEQDIITELVPEDEIKRAELGGVPPQNFIVNYRGEDFKINNHIHGQRLRKILLEQNENHIWEDYFKFAFERNPWDRVLSAYTYVPNRNIAFDDFVTEDRLIKLKKRGRNIYMHKEEMIVDEVYKFEELELARKSISERLNLPFNDKLMPESKVSRVKESSHSYRDYYNKSTKELVRKVFEDVIDFQKYTF